ncbi:MAG: SDR family oxidoreductase [Chloroflexota bacterium]|nr:MAG: SDR family oxidoreductase [Chloroflexota bacterium]
MSATMPQPPSGDLGSLLRLDGKVAVVTGAAQRIGREISRAFAGQGAAVVVTDIQDERGQATVEEIRAAGGEAIYRRADVSQSGDIADMVRFAADRYGRLDILVNNAHWEKVGNVVELDEEDWDRSFDVLLKALYLGCKYAIPEMRTVGGGVIINISSVHAYHVSDRYVTYQAAKAAVVHFTRQVAWDFGPDNIRCNCVCPGAVPLPSEVTEHSARDPLFVEEQTLLKAIKRIGQPADIARAALFLVSDLSSWITGQALTVDGGEFMTFPSTGAQRTRRFLEAHPERVSPSYRLTP